MRLLWVVLLCAGCGRTGLPSDVDGGGLFGDAGRTDAGLVGDAGETDAGLSDAGVNDAGLGDGGSCVPSGLQPAALQTFGPRLSLPQFPLESPKVLDGVMTPAGPVFALIAPDSTPPYDEHKVLLVGPTWTREVNTGLHEAFNVHLAWNGSQLALTYSRNAELTLVLFDAQGMLQHRRVVDVSQNGRNDLSTGFAGGTWVPVWTNSNGSEFEAWATRIFPDGGDQTLTQKVTQARLATSPFAMGVTPLVSDAGIKALVLGQEAVLALTDLQPMHQREVSLPGGTGHGALVDLGGDGLTAVYFGSGPNARRPDLLRVEVAYDGGLRTSIVAEQPALYAVHDVAAVACGRRLVIAYTDDTSGAGPCINDYCYRPLLHVTADLDGGDWRSPETDGGYARSVTILRNGDSLDVAWLSVRADNTAQITIAPSMIRCCD